MKKVIAVVAVVCVMFAAGSALAQPKDRRNQPQNVQQMNRPQRNAPDFQERGPRFQNVSDDFRGPRGDFKPGFGGRHCGFEGRGHRGPTFTPDMPKEIREKATELAKLRIDLEEAMTSRPLNKEKALEVHAKMQKVEQEVEAWRFAQRLERIEEMQKQRELNRTVPPARTETATD
ncbi:MAG: hypothetical protein IJQ15_05125 [Synergistaceae bacterium]|nr:hypothetical protein [Synergistaceae bacterium]MBQ6981794.1 hypothetical protein [Synergistaceae bacterium]